MRRITRCSSHEAEYCVEVKSKLVLFDSGSGALHTYRAKKLKWFFGFRYWSNIAPRRYSVIQAEADVARQSEIDAMKSMYYCLEGDKQ